MKKLLTAITAVLILGGCGVDVHYPQIRKAQEVCAEHDGVNRIRAWDDNHNAVEATCNNGKKFYSDMSES